MTDTPFSSTISAIESLWGSGWTGHDGIPVYWHHNSADIVPSRATTDYWVHLAVEFDDEYAIAWGQGPKQSERELRGCVVIRVFAGRGLGESIMLGLLDDAITVFRGQRVGPLSFIGDIVQQQPGASDDGGFWIRSALACFTFRFKG